MITIEYLEDALKDISFEEGDSITISENLFYALKINRCGAWLSKNLEMKVFNGLIDEDSFRFLLDGFHGSQFKLIDLHRIVNKRKALRNFK